MLQKLVFVGILALFACNQESPSDPKDAAPTDMTTPDLSMQDQFQPDLAPAHAAVNFAVLGDIPYKPADYAILQSQVTSFPATTEFAMHIGDIKNGDDPCVETIYTNVAAILKLSTRPLFIVPGDNEWNDCTDPVQAWKFWTASYLHFDQHFNHSLGVTYDDKNGHGENMAFLYRGVLFVGLNLVGGKIHDAAEWSARHAANLRFTKENIAMHKAALRSVVIFAQAEPTSAHTDYFNGLSAEAMALGRPVLYVHGDLHNYYCKRNFAAKNILNVQIDDSVKAPPLQITATLDPNEPFIFDRGLGQGPIKGSSCM